MRRLAAVGAGALLGLAIMAGLLYILACFDDRSLDVC